jgi:hypothetical protein
MRHHFSISFLALSAVICLAPPPAASQGVFGKGIPGGESKPAPRLADGHVDLGNGKGSWEIRRIEDVSGNGGGENPGEANKQRQLKVLDKRVDVPFLPDAKKIYDQRQATVSKDDPEGFCLPPGVPRHMNTPFPLQIYQLPDRIIQVLEGGAHMWRVIYMDGRKHTPLEKLNPTYMGESIGHWEGDTLVVDVIGFNERTWIDSAGHPHTEQMHVVERYTRTNYNTLHYQFTVDDPGSYKGSWGNGWNVTWAEGMEPLEYVCQENNKDVVIENHMVGASPGEKR